MEWVENINELCEAEVRKNLVLAEIGEPLTIPLAVLNKNCKFKKEWDRIQTKWHGIPEEIKARKKAYREKPETKAKMKAYREKPETKAKMKAYREKPETKARKKAYREKPETKARIKAYLKTYREKHKTR